MGNTSAMAILYVTRDWLNRVFGSMADMIDSGDALTSGPLTDLRTGTTFTVRQGRERGPGLYAIECSVTNAEVLQERYQTGN